MGKSKYTFNEERQEWRTQVWDGTYNKDGSKHRKSIASKKSSKDLERKVAELKRDVEDCEYNDCGNETFLNYANRWLEVAKSTKEKNTKQMYSTVINTYFDDIADMPLANINHSHFQEIINKNSNHPRTCEQIYLTFRQIIKMAIRDRILPKSAFEDICEDISVPKRIKPVKRPLTAVEKNAVLNANVEGQQAAFLYIIYFCGLRRGEALALSASDFDFEKKVLIVNKSIVFIKNNPELKPYPKTDNGIRNVPMPDELIRRIGQYIKTQDGQIFRTNGKELMTKTSYIKMWRQITKALNENSDEEIKLTAHAFRHNYCTELCYQIPAISTKMIAKVLGDTERMVLEVYSHLDEDREDISGAINTAFKN